MAGIDWTHPSVLALGDDAEANDPVVTIEKRAREITLTAIEEGWTGPPYDPFALAEALGIDLVARQDLDDARLIAHDGRPRIEFNPARRPARVRFSIAHEIGHFLFADYAERPRYRGDVQRRRDDWQLEILCNIAAAEFLMPVGAFPATELEGFSLPHLLDQRARFGVSTEALLRRAVKLNDRATCLFAAARTSDPPGFRIDYLVPSRAWRPPFSAGFTVAPGSVLHRCTAVGFSDDADETWAGEAMHVQVVGVPPFPGERFPRLIGLLNPAEDHDARDTTLRYVRGDASEPRADGAAIIAHLVNDRAGSWGGRGFAGSLMERFPAAKDEYTAWATGGQLQRGALHLAEVDEKLSIASLVAQAGYGDSPGRMPRLRLAALGTALRRLADLAIESEATVHIPPIGTGQAGGRWPEIRDLILDELADRGIVTTVYVLPHEPMPEDVPADEQLTLL